MPGCSWPLGVWSVWLSKLLECAATTRLLSLGITERKRSKVAYARGYTER